MINAAIIRKHLIFISTGFLIIQCKNAGKYSGQDIEFRSLKESIFTNDSIPPGTPLNLIVYSGGKANSEGEIYYYQFIAVNSNNGDTVRILSTLISVAGEEDAANKVYTPTSQFEPGKRINSAIFYPQDSTHELSIYFTTTEISDHNKDADLEKIKSVIEHGFKKREYVVINKSMGIFQRDYKTVFGVLHFTEQPW